MRVHKEESHARVPERMLPHTDELTHPEDTYHLRVFIPPP